MNWILDFRMMSWLVVKLNYFISRFFERPNAANIQNEIHAALKPVSGEKMIELSMDGPNINWKVFDLLKSHRREAEWSPLMNMRSCSLHIVHGAFQTGNKATDWQIDIVLKAM